MANNDKTSRIEAFKAFSTFFSSVIIASASIVVTLAYNNQQLKITNNQAISKMKIVRIQEISRLIPQLGSENFDERKFAAIALSLYGEDAIPALVAMLEDDNQDVRTITTKAIALIGEPAIQELEKAFRDRRNSGSLRAASIYTLGRMKSANAKQLAMRAIKDNSEHKYVRKDAAWALGALKDPTSVPVLLKAMQSNTNIDLVRNSIWALGEIGVKGINEQLVKMLKHNNDKIRIEAIWAMAKLKDDNTVSILQNIINEGTNEEVCDAATNAIEWMK